MDRQREDMWALNWSGRLLWVVLLLLVPVRGIWADLIVVANEHAGTLSIVDHKAGRAVGTLTVGGDPHNLAVTTDGRWVVVTHPSAGMVTVVDPRLPAVVKRLEVAGSPHGVVVSPDGRWAFVGAEQARRVHVLDLQRMELDRAFHVEPAPTTWS